MLYFLAVAGDGRQLDPRMRHSAREGVMRMTLAEFISTLSLVITSFALGYTIGKNHKK